MNDYLLYISSVWILPFSVFLVAIGIVVSIAEEWKAKGLTDTSIATLVMWTVGLTGVLAHGMIQKIDNLFIVTVVPIAIFVGCIVMKIRDIKKSVPPHLRNR